MKEEKVLCQELVQIMKQKSLQYVIGIVVITTFYLPICE